MTLLAPLREQGLTALLYAQYLTKYLDLEKEDVIIGHSMGGWVALHVKHLVGCCIVQISSWTDSRKIINVPVVRHLMYWLAKRGIDFNSFVLRILVWLHYNNKPSCKIFIATFERLRTGNKKIAAKQLMVIFNSVKEAVTVTADLRIHAKGDRIVNSPDQDFYAVPGDHFSVYTYPEAVYKPIVEFLKRINSYYYK